MLHDIGKMRLLMGLLAVSGMIFLAFQAVGSGPEKASASIRSDIVEITTRLPKGRSEMQRVIFQHDKHTAALAEGSCTSCHPKTEKGIVFRFRQVEPVAPEEAKDLYHEGCISCHKETKAAGKDSGPLAADCRVCHKDDTEYASGWSEITFSKSLHYRHVASKAIRPIDGAIARKDGGNCSACHHAFDLKAEKLAYTKGEEGSCGYCHKSVATRDDMIRRNVPAIREASHASCVGCHTDRALEKKKGGPTTCAGCHDKIERSKYTVVEEIPRLDRNQPDAVLLATGLKMAAAEGTQPKAVVDAVAFNHVSHEKGVESCKTCHHASLESCGSCHTPGGDEKGDYVRLGQAMHGQGANASCVSCHETSKQKSSCAGCHNQMPAKKFQDTNCRLCHNIDPVTITPFAGDKDWRARIAAEEVAARTRMLAMVARKDIPETVTIDAMVNRFEAVKLPHGKIVQAIYDSLIDDRMARYFHREPTTLCQGCHHHSPASLKPPRCESCHGEPFVEGPGGRPGLQGAYHLQCIGCHEDMGIEKPSANDCSACHAKRKQGGTPSATSQ